MTPPVSDARKQEILRFLDGATTEANAKVIRDEVERILKHQGVDASRYMPRDRQLAALVNELRGLAGLPSEAVEAVDPELQVPAEYFPVEAEPLNSPTHLSSNVTPTELRWVKLSQGENRELLHTMARESFPNGAAHQDGLKCFVRGAEPQKMSLGGMLESGAALMFSKAQLSGILSALSQQLPTAELFQAAAFLQTAIPLLLAGEGKEGFAGALQRCLQNLALKQGELPKFFAALLELCGESGLSALPGMQELLLQTLGANLQGQADALEDPNGVHDGIHALFQGAAFAGMPILNGLKEFSGGTGLWQRLSQLLQPLMRALSGFFLTNPESQWPKCLPNEKYLAELGAMFGSQLYRTKSKETRRRKRKPGRNYVFGHQDLSDPSVPSDDSDAPMLNPHQPQCFEYQV